MKAIDHTVKIITPNDTIIDYLAETPTDSVKYTTTFTSIIKLPHTFRVYINHLIESATLVSNLKYVRNQQ